MYFGGMDGCSKRVQPLVCQESRAQPYSGVWTTVGEFGDTEVDMKKKQSCCRAGQVDLLLSGIATSRGDTEVSEVGTDPSGSDLAG